MVLNSFFNFVVSFLSDPEEPKEKLENFYYLSLIREQDGSFSIHGLWPQTTIDSYPEYCKKVTFDINALNPIMSQLKNFWYSTQEKNEDFWEHEWEKHGSCVFSDINEYEYFNKTLDLFKTAIQTGLPQEFYDNENNKCLIPLSLDFKFILD